MTRTSRPALHFTPERNWINDPNGLVHHDGEYHLFFQYNPEGTDWGNMSWGHAVSTDLLTWEELPVAIRHTPEEAAFSGSAVIDHDDTAGFGAGAMVAIYTGHHPVTGKQRQCLAWSVDNGRTFTRYAGNPVLDIDVHEFRDPKVHWDAEHTRWVMTVALPHERTVHFYSSPDLKRWSLLSTFGPAGSTEGIWECPDLFPLPVDGDPDQMAWVLLVSVGDHGPAGGSGMQYFVGDWDGTTFRPITDVPAPRWLDHGPDCYAGITWDGLPRGERAMIAWMNNWSYVAATPAEEYRGQMTLVRRLELRTHGDDVVMVQAPVLPVAAAGALDGEAVVDAREPVHAPAVVTVCVPRSGGSVVLDLGTGGDLEVGVADDQVYVDRTCLTGAPLPAGFSAWHRAPLTTDSEVALTLVVDSGSVEIFAEEGRTVLTELVFPAIDRFTVTAADTVATSGVHVRSLAAS